VRAEHAVADAQKVWREGEDLRPRAAVWSEVAILASCNYRIALREIHWLAHDAQSVTELLFHPAVHRQQRIYSAANGMSLATITSIAAIQTAR